MTYISFPTFDIRPLKAHKRKKKQSGTTDQKTVGILGGLAPQSTSLFYDTITQSVLKQNLPAFPRLLINSVNTWEVIKILKEKDLESLYDFLKYEIDLIAEQVDFLVMVCNSIHAVLAPLRKTTPVPILSIYEEVGKEIAVSSIKKVGILGTSTTINHCFYQNELSSYGIAYALLSEEKEAAFDAFIFEEVVHGKGKGIMRSLILEGIDYLKNQGCEGVILACTELPLFVKQKDTDIPLFSSTQILAQAVMEECFRQ